MQLQLVVRFVILLAIANGAPLLAKKLLGSSLAHPLDGGRILSDGHPLFGPSKTVRGVVACVAAAALCAPLLGFDWTTGILVGSAAMAGDLVSSFLKRRMGRPPSSRAWGLDQIPESLFPALASMDNVGLTLADTFLVVVLFTLSGQVISLLLFKMRLRDHPY